MTTNNGTYIRKCENWLSDFNKWTLPRTQAPLSYHNWTGLFCLSSAIRRHVKVGKKYLGGWECDPHLYTFFVGPAGATNKSTVMGFSDELLTNVPNLVRVPDSFSTPILLQKLSKVNDNAIYILSSEFANLFQKAGPAVYDVLTDLFDGRKKIEGETISRGYEFAHRPVINLLAGTTPQWLAANMSEAVIGGGFASRVLFIFEEKPRLHRLYYDDLDTNGFDTLKNNLISDLKHIAENIHGEFDISSNARKYMAHWYESNGQVTKPGVRTEGFYNRKSKHIHTVAMLTHLSYSDDLILGLSDFETAIRIIEDTEPNLNEAFRKIGGLNKYSLTMEGMIDFVREKKKVPMIVLKKHFQASAEPRVLDELIMALVSTKQLKMEKGDVSVNEET